MIALVSGPSGAGKSRVIEEFKSFRHEKLNINIKVLHALKDTHTNEVNGKDYFFVSQPEFEDLIKQGYFFEYVKYHNNYYGVPAENLTFDNEHITMFDVLCESGKKFISAFPQDVKEGTMQSCYINAPSREALNERRGNRGEDRVKQDIEQSRIALSFYNWYLINHNIADTADNMYNIMRRFLEKPTQCDTTDLRMFSMKEQDNIKHLESVLC